MTGPPLLRLLLGRPVLGRGLGLALRPLRAKGLLASLFQILLVTWRELQNLIFLALLLNGVGSLLTPVTATAAGFTGLVAVRFFMGIGQVALTFTTRPASPLTSPHNAGHPLPLLRLTGRPLVSAHGEEHRRRHFHLGEPGWRIVQSRSFQTQRHLQMSQVVGMPLNAWLCQQKNLLGGWPVIFYLPGNWSTRF